MKLFVVPAMVVLFPLIVQAENWVQVQIVATHMVTHEDTGPRAIVDKGVLGANAATRSMESFNLDAVINNEHVFLACDDPKGCESPGVGIFTGSLKRDKWIKLKFTIPVSHKEISRWYRISGTW